MSKPWDETWVVRGLRNPMVVEREHGLGRAMPFSSLTETTAMPPHSVSALIAAAPAMARLLCRLEWSKDWCSECRGCSDECRVCGHDRGGHAPDCALDAALTAAGLDAEERERVRGG